MQNASGGEMKQFVLTSDAPSESCVGGVKWIQGVRSGQRRGGAFTLSKPSMRDTSQVSDCLLGPQVRF